MQCFKLSFEIVVLVSAHALKLHLLITYCASSFDCDVAYVCWHFHCSWWWTLSMIPIKMCGQLVCMRDGMAQSACFVQSLGGIGWQDISFAFVNILCLLRMKGEILAFMLISCSSHQCQAANAPVCNVYKNTTRILDELGAMHPALYSTEAWIAF